MPLIVRGEIVDIGAVFKAKEGAEKIGVCKEGVIITVVDLNEKSNDYSVGVCSDVFVYGWHDLSGLTPNRHGYWLNPDTLTKYFERINSTLRIAENVIFNGVNISGMKCKLLKEIRPLGCKFVELEEYVNGGSADGLGKPGHCIPLQSDLVTLENGGEDCHKKRNPGKA